MSDKIIKYRLFDAALLNGLATLTTGAIDVRSAKNVQGLRILATSVLAQGSVDFQIDMAVSDYLPNQNKPDWVSAPVEDYDAFTTRLLDHWNATPNPADWQVIPMPAPLAPVIKIRFSGLGSNPSDVLLTAKLIVQESL